MPHKDNITLGPGTLFFNGPEGLQPLGEVQEVEITEETELDVLGDVPRVIVPQKAELSLTINADCQAILDKLAEAAKAWIILWETLGPMLDRLAKDPRTPKLVHLTKHGKNRRIRKKNAKRLVRIMKGE